MTPIPAAVRQIVTRLLPATAAILHLPRKLLLSNQVMPTTATAAVLQAQYPQLKNPRNRLKITWIKSRSLCQSLKLWPRRSQKILKKIKIKLFWHQTSFSRRRMIWKRKEIFGSKRRITKKQALNMRELSCILELCNLWAFLSCKLLKQKKRSRKTRKEPKKLEPQTTQEIPEMIQIIHRASKISTVWQNGWRSPNSGESSLKRDIL